jgi:hypothetical protein
MMRNRWGIVVILLLIVVPLMAVAQISANPVYQGVEAVPTPTGPIATEDELARAREEWGLSAHADTFDEGMGANTTCARCKSPLNWDPAQDLAAQEALDCFSCKRAPGADRPDLESGAAVPLAEWHDINCDVCHVPAGDSYYTSIAFWDQALGQYEYPETVMELCAHCHEGRHGFEVVEEQKQSSAHTNWPCTECHGSHGAAAACTDCHEPGTGPGAIEHGRHANVNCTGCHDDGGLSIWLDSDVLSPHEGDYITRRFAHTLTSWPSHNLSRDVGCKSCHHPGKDGGPAIVPGVPCDACHEHPYGAVSVWCTYFDRNVNPNPINSTGPE